MHPTLPAESAHNPYSRVLEGHHLSIRLAPRTDRARKSPLIVEPIRGIIRNATRPGFPQGKLVKKRKKNQKRKRKRPVENAAAMEIRQRIGCLRRLFLDADSHSCLEKPRSIARLFHIYHRPQYYQSTWNKIVFLKTIRGMSLDANSFTPSRPRLQLISTFCNTLFQGGVAPPSIKWSPSFN